MRLTQITGRILHSQEPSPIHNIAVELYRKGCFHLKRNVLCTIRTYSNGKFRVFYDVDNKVKDLFIRVYDPRDAKKETLFEKSFTVDTSALKNRLGDMRVPFFEYLPGWARLNWDKSNSAGEKDNIAFLKELAFDSVLPKGTELILHAAQKEPPLEKVIEAFDETPMAKKERKNPGIIDDPEFTVKRLFEGFAEPYWIKGPSEDIVLSRYNFNHLEMDGENYLPNIELALRLVDEKTLPKIEYIKVQWRKHKEFGEILPPVQSLDNLEDEKTYYPSDEGFSNALLAYRIAWNVSGQNRRHLTLRHVYCEGILLAAKRCFIDNPVGKLFFIFGEGLLRINHMGESAIFGSHGLITETSALTANSVEVDMKQWQGAYDHTGRKPRKPLFAGDKAAHIHNAWWDVISEFVNDYFEKNKEEMKSKTGWREVLAFSKDLVEHSQPFHLPDELDPEQWVDPSEFGDLTAPREVIDGVEKAIRHIATSTDPNSEDIEKLKSVVVQFICDVTIGHTLEHDVGTVEGSYPYYASQGGGGVVLGEKEKLLPSSHNAAMTISNLLIFKAYKFGYLTQQEDIPKELIDLIENYREKLTGAGWNPDKVRSGIKI